MQYPVYGIQSAVRSNCSGSPPTFVQRYEVKIPAMHFKCPAIFALPNGSIVQGIECGFPVPKIQVRVLVGLQSKRGQRRKELSSFAL